MFKKFLCVFAIALLFVALDVKPNNKKTSEKEGVKKEFNTGCDVLDEGLRRLNRVCLKGQKADSREELDEIRKKYGEEFRAWEQKNIEILDSVYEIEDAFYKFDAEIEKMQNAFWEKHRSLIEKEERERAERAEKERKEQIMAELPEEDIEEDIEVFDMPLPPPPEEVIASEEVCPSLLLCEYYKIYYYREVRRYDFLEDIYREYITDEKLLEKKLERIYSRRREALKEHSLGQIFAVPTVDQPASYPGGESALINWLANNIQYPPRAAEEGARGRVVVLFVVEKDGRVGYVEVFSGRHPELNKEAIRLIKSIKPNFIPGKINGQPVRQWFVLPINFKLPQ